MVHSLPLHIAVEVDLRLIKWMGSGGANFMDGSPRGEGSCVSFA